jgi:hypothetical protein
MERWLRYINEDRELTFGNLQVWSSLRECALNFFSAEKWLYCYIRMMNVTAFFCEMNTYERERLWPILRRHGDVH